MRILFILSLFAGTLAGFISSGFTSNLRVPANQTFYLGGAQKESAPVSAQNTGLVEVTLALQTPGGEPSVLQVLKPGQKAKATVPAKTALLIRNETQTEARLLVTGPSKLGAMSMEYKMEHK